jgi:glycyl-tRNA synthetase beta chain
MDRELLVEIGCEEIPAGWLPGLTTQIARHLEARLKEFRLAPGAPVESFSTPRRLTVRVAKVAERQTDLEEVITGPPVSAAFKPDGQPTPAAAGFAKKYGVDVSALEKHETPKGTYLAYKLHQRGKAAVDVLADMTAGVLRDMTFPKQMRWDAYLEDGKEELVFARPIRWMVLLYGGRVVPFVIRRSENAQGPLVQDVRSGANTYGHRFLTTSGRAGRAIKVKTFDDYKARLAENFVILDRSEREARIRRELETHARRLGGRVGTSGNATASAVAGAASLLHEVPDLVEYPAVVAGHFPVEFLELPEEVLTTTMIHHQHYFPVVDDDGRLKPAFLAVVNMQPEKPEIISRNSERVLTARLRDARFFYDEDRRAGLGKRAERLSTILFHKKLGTYKEKADRIAPLAGWIAGTAFGKPQAEASAVEAGRLCKVDLATDMVRELTELQGTIGGIYAREERHPEEVWKAIYYHYLPIGVEADAPPTKQQLGSAAVTWAAVSLADKLDSVVGMFVAGERPTGSRDPLGLRRQAQGAVKILADLPELTGIDARLTLGFLLRRAAEPFGGFKDAEQPLYAFMSDRVAYLLEQRGFDVRAVRAVLHEGVENLSPLTARRKLDALREMSGSAALLGVATLLKRAKNITKSVKPVALVDVRARLTEAAEVALADELTRRGATVQTAIARDDYRDAFSQIAELQPVVAKFFDDVMVMVDDPGLREARLAVVTTLRDLILPIADLSEMVAEKD